MPVTPCMPRLPWGGVGFLGQFPWLSQASGGGELGAQHWGLAHPSLHSQLQLCWGARQWDLKAGLAVSEPSCLVMPPPPDCCPMPYSASRPRKPSLLPVPRTWRPPSPTSGCSCPRPHSWLWVSLWAGKEQARPGWGGHGGTKQGEMHVPGLEAARLGCSTGLSSDRLGLGEGPQPAQVGVHREAAA